MNDVLVNWAFVVFHRELALWDWGGRRFFFLMLHGDDSEADLLKGLVSFELFSTSPNEVNIES